MDNSRRCITAVVCLLLLYTASCTFNICTAERASRSIPFLVYPNGGALKWVVGLSIPVKVSNRSVGMLLQFQGLYAHPSNISEISQHFPLNVGRAAIYAVFTSIMNALGTDGHACLLRAVCEAAETPLLHNGLFGEVAHLLLTPSDGDAGLAEHVLAREAGRGGCRRRYAACPRGRGLLDAVSTLSVDSQHWDR
ncbi:uncharacterized protein LOC124622720 [Schistocerca americana]|uniref:uncharacterized protein LOC124622720 n=1 Tax=Schistocerca americana TaxID=7009 RepID=UPI001F4F9A13|nr:uncharacterized protein LOC124622720 [Schistocerca americana]